jgi:DNA-binding LytR/AlgR family response regulator
MNKLSLIIIDDEKSARDLLRNLLESESWLEILGEANCVDNALPEILMKKPDVILLDIHMPIKDGFVLIEKMIELQIQVEIIFITAYEKYAIRAIKASAFDYLLKPVKKKELLASLKRLSEKVDSERINDRFSELMHHLSDQKKIKFKNRNGFSMIDPDDILYCQADSNYTILELDTGKKLIISINLGKVEEILPQQGFCRISRSVIVNLKYLTQVDRKTQTCILVNKSSLTLSISRKYMRHLEITCDHLFVH